MHARRSILLLLLIAALSSRGLSQTEEQFLPSEVKQLTIVTEPVSLPKGFFRLGSVFTYGMVDKIFNDQGRKEYLAESTWGTDWSISLLGQYGITDRLQVDLMLPYRNLAFYNSWGYVMLPEDLQEDMTWDLKGSGLGDIDLYTRYQILTETERRPSLVGEVSVTLPTGSKNPKDINDWYDFKLPTGYGEVNLGARLQLRKIIYPVSYKLHGDYTYSLGGKKRFNPDDLEERSFKSGARVNIGGSGDILLNDWISLANDLNFTYAWKGEKEDAFEGELYSYWLVAYEVGFVFQIRKFRVAERVSVPLKGINIHADPLYVLMVQYIF